MEDSKFYIHQSSIIDLPVKIGNGTKIWHFCHIMQDCSIGDNCILGQNVMIANNVIIGNNVKIQNNVSLYSGVRVFDDVFIGPSVVFTNILNPRSFVNRKNEYLNTNVEEGASIGANATILCGINIGKYSLIGAGSVVTKNVNDFEIVMGNPAVQSGYVSKYGEKLNFNNENKAYCIKTNELYVLSNNKVILIEKN